MAELPRYVLFPMFTLVLVAVWLAGGVTVDATAADEWLLLLSIPLLLCAGWLLLESGVPDRLQRWALLAAGLVLLVPALQLLPLLAAAWGMAPARAALLPELAAAGVDGLRMRGSLSPAATEQSLWSLLPALALFLAALAMTSSQRGLVARLVLLLVGLNVLFAFFQAGLPDASALRLYAAAGAGFGGLLVNTNHQATALMIAMALAVGLAVHAWRRDQAGRGRPLAWLWYAGTAGACVLLLPLTTSRAGMSLALPALAAVLWLSGAISLRRSQRPSARSLVLLVLAAVLAVVGIRAAIGWIAVDDAEELRHLLSAATLQAASAQAPWGSGMGSFVRVFEQSAPPSLWMEVYVNHAHNEFAQWWLEAGVPGMLALLAVLGVLGVVGWRILQARGRDGDAILAAACFVAICAVLAHSAADFPLRTLTLMGTVAALAGVMLGALADSVAQDHAQPATNGHMTLSQSA